MTKDKNIKIKLELYRDNVGDMGLIIHFDEKSPNVVIEDNEYIWMPTIEEKNLIDESFGLLPGSGKGYIPPAPEETKEKITDLETEKQQPEVKPEPKEEIPQQPKAEEPAVFEVTDEQQKSSSIEEELDSKPPETKPETKDESQKEKEDSEKEKKLEDAVIVEADSDAIEAALKKHQKKDEDDDSIKEADEKTIIDKVLKQKKKGKWSKK